MTTTTTTTTTTTVPDTCAQDGKCVVGNTGPGGGIVFYVHPGGGTFASPGSDCGSSCRYLEAAPYDHPTRIAWCSITRTALGVTATGIGSGMGNTTKADATCTSGAIQIAADYSNNGKTDWHLPSKDELNELCKYALPTASTSAECSPAVLPASVRRPFRLEFYWSSSEVLGFHGATDAWVFHFGYGNPGGWVKASPDMVRVVRAF
jgi:hypothetical protein